MQSQNGNNPLIELEKADTIENITQYSHQLCDQVAQDADVHPGFVLQLRVLHEAIKSLTHA